MGLSTKKVEPSLVQLKYHVWAFIGHIGVTPNSQALFARLKCMAKNTGTK